MDFFFKLVCMVILAGICSASKPGTCPAEVDKTAVLERFGRRCKQNDYDCPSYLKCCQGMCVQPVCADDKTYLTCFVNPCDVSTCEGVPGAECFQRTCPNDCEAEWFTKELGNVTDLCNRDTPDVNDDDEDDVDLASKPGTCPAEVDTTAVLERFDRRCKQNDYDCPSYLKCCQGMCVQPVCADDKTYLTCFVNPCDVSTCEGVPGAECFQRTCPNDCGAEWFTKELGNVTDLCNGDTPDVNDDEGDDVDLDDDDVFDGNGEVEEPKAEIDGDDDGEDDDDKDEGYPVDSRKGRKHDRRGRKQKWMAKKKAKKMAKKAEREERRQSKMEARNEASDVANVRKENKMKRKEEKKKMWELKKEERIAKKMERKAEKAAKKAIRGKSKEEKTATKEAKRAAWMKKRQQRKEEKKQRKQGRQNRRQNRKRVAIE